MTPIRDPRLPERFWDKVVVDADCWRWTGAVKERGYGRVYMDGKARSAYKVAFEALVGPVPPGLVLDHLCRTPSCVNPSHLEPVTNAENIRRGQAGASARNGETCRNGVHPWPESAVPVEQGRFRACGRCKRERARRSLSERVICEGCGKSGRRGDRARHRVVCSRSAVNA